MNRIQLVEVEYGVGVYVGQYSSIGRIPMVPIGVTSNSNKSSGKPVIIGDGTIIGSGVVIYEDVIIGKNCIIGDGVKLRDTCRIGDSCIIGMNTKVGNRTIIGNRVKIMDLCNISGDMVIEDDVFIAQGVMCANDNTMGRDVNWQGGHGSHCGPVIKRFATVGMNASLLPNVEIGENSIVAAGSLVSKDVKPRTVVMGVPAKYKRNLLNKEIKHELYT